MRYRRSSPLVGNGLLFLPFLLRRPLGRRKAVGILCRRVSSSLRPDPFHGGVYLRPLTHLSHPHLVRVLAYGVEGSTCAGYLEYPFLNMQ